MEAIEAVAARADSASSYPARFQLIAASSNARAELMLRVTADNELSKLDGGASIASGPGSLAFAPMCESRITALC